MASFPVLEIAKSLAPLIESTAGAGEAAGKLAPEIVAAFHEHNLLGLYMPPDFGGLGLSLANSLEVIEAISYADGASGWVLMVGSFSAAACMAYLPDDTAHDLFGPGKRIPMMAGMGAPVGKAIPASNGFTLSGKYSYASGAPHADYILAGATVMENGAPRRTEAGAPDMRLFIAPREKVSLGGNWDVMGLRGTGSIDYAIDNLFVPENYSFSPGSRNTKRGALFRLGMFDLVAIGHEGVALGIGRRLLDEIALFAQGKKMPGGVGSSESFQEQFAHHEAELRSARAFIMEVWREVEADLHAGKDITTRQYSLIRLSLNHVTIVAADIANFAYRSAGGTSLRSGIIQRFFRDMLAASQHVAVSTGILRGCGKDLAGLAPGAVWTGLALTDPVSKL